MKTKRTVSVVLLVMLSVCLLCGLTACSGRSTAMEPSSEPSSTETAKPTVVGRWSHIDKGEAWTIGFTEDGDFYDSSGSLMETFYGVSSWSSKYGSWNIRADGNLWFTTTMTVQGVGQRPHQDDFSWGYTYELDGDFLKIGDNIFTRIK